MKLVKSLIANVILCGALLFAFAYFNIGIKIVFQGVSISEMQFTWNLFPQLLITFLSFGAVFWILNTPIKKILGILTIPVNALTLGLFSLVLNVFIFYLFQYIVNTYAVNYGIEASVQLGTLVQTLILSLVMALALTILKKLS